MKIIMSLHNHTNKLVRNKILLIKYYLLIKIMSKSRFKRTQNVLNKLKVKCNKMIKIKIDMNIIIKTYLKL